METVTISRQDLQNCVYALNYCLLTLPVGDPFITKITKNRDAAEAALKKARGAS